MSGNGSRVNVIAAALASGFVNGHGRGRMGGIAHSANVRGRVVPHIKPRAGRNDPCPCGSGKKYKKCCIK